MEKRPRAARHARIVGLAHHLAAGLAGDAARPAPGPSRVSAWPVISSSVVAPPLLQDPGGGLDGLRRIAGALRLGRHRRDAVGLVPCGVGRQDQRRDLARMPLAAAIAAAPSAATDLESGEVCTQCDIGRARPSMSEVSGALYSM